MNERPIAFGGSMVRAILGGGKTQTRRIVDPQPEARATVYPMPLDGEWYWQHKKLHAGYLHTGRRAMERLMVPLCPYGKVGDHLWVRETWRARAPDQDGCTIDYRADHWTEDPCDVPWRPSIHMPRWASRITLEITDVRVERLQEISASDALAEGVTHSTLNDPRVEYRWLWESIYGTGSWDANPWVWVVEFRRVQ